MKKSWYSYVRSHDLVNRIYDMMIELRILKQDDININIKKILYRRLEDVEYVESIIISFERRNKRYKNNQILFNKVKDLVYELEYLKEFLY